MKESRKIFLKIVLVPIVSLLIFQFLSFPIYAPFSGDFLISLNFILFLFQACCIITLFFMFYFPFFYFFETKTLGRNVIIFYPFLSCLIGVIVFILFSLFSSASFQPSKWRIGGGYSIFIIFGFLSLCFGFFYPLFLFFSRETFLKLIKAYLVLLLVLSSIIYSVFTYYKANFSFILQRKAEEIVKGKPYCILVYFPEEGFKTVSSFDEISFEKILRRAWNETWPFSRKRPRPHDQEIYFVIISGSLNWHHWSFSGQKFMSDLGGYWGIHNTHIKNCSCQNPPQKPDRDYFFCK